MSENGVKHDSDKTRYDLVPSEALEMVAKIFTMGAKKYNDDNWKFVEEKRYISALMRHLEAHRQGKFLDSESGLPHLAHVATNALIMLQKFVIKDQDFIDKAVKKSYNTYSDVELDFMEAEAEKIRKLYINKEEFIQEVKENVSEIIEKQADYLFDV